MGQTDAKTCVWYTDADGARYREGDEVFCNIHGRVLRCTVLALYIEGERPMVALGTTRGAVFVDSRAVRVWPNGR